MLCGSLVWKAGDRLTQYKIYYHIKCNKDAEVSVFASHRIQKRSDIYKGVAGSQEKVDVKLGFCQGTEFKLPEYTRMCIRKKSVSES